MRLVNLLLRTDVLRCYSALLRDAGRQLQHQPSSSNVELAAEVLAEVNKLLSALARAAMGVKWRDDLGDTAAPVQAVCAVTRLQYCHSAAAEIRNSCLLDAWATCFLQLVASGEHDSDKAAQLSAGFSTAVRHYHLWFARKDTIFCAPDAGILYFLAAHVVRAVTAMDGGTTYGMPADAPQVPLLTQDGAAAVQSDIGKSANARLLIMALSWWPHILQSGDRAAEPAAFDAFPPFHRTATFDISIRLIQAIAARLLQRAHAGEVGMPYEAVRLALCGAEAALRELIRRNPTDVAPDNVERLRTFWAAYGRVLDAAMASLDGTGPAAVASDAAARPRGSDGDRQCGLRPLPVLGERGSFLPTIADMVPTVQGVPARLDRLGAEAEVVLSSGAIARMERLMRLNVGNVAPLCGDTVWTEMLMFGPAPELAALFATAAKFTLGCVYRLAAELETCQQVSARGAGGDSDLMLQRSDLPDSLTAAAGFLNAATHWVRSREHLVSVFTDGDGDFDLSAYEVHDGGAPGSGGAAGSGGDAGRSGGGNGGVAGSSSTNEGAARSGAVDAAGGRSQAPSSRQLFELTSFAAVRLLPAVSLALQYFELPSLERVRSQMIVFGDVYQALRIALRVCALLLVAALPSTARPFASGASAAAAPAAAAPEAQWRQLLLGDVDLMGLLGAAAKALGGCTDTTIWRGQDSVLGCAEDFAEVLRLTCAVFPEELRAALGGATSGAGGAGGSGRPKAPAPPSAAAAAAGGQFKGYLALPVLSCLLGANGAFPDAETLEMLRRLAKKGAVREPGMPFSLLCVAPELPPPDEVRRRMAAHCCANPACANLEGPSEVSLPRRRCGGGCGGRVWWYCSRECQVAHWRAGHKVKCEAACVAGAGGSRGPLGAEARG